jgi:hypothetical protein
MIFDRITAGMDEQTKRFNQVMLDLSPRGGKNSGDQDFS